MKEAKQHILENAHTENLFMLFVKRIRHSLFEMNSIVSIHTFPSNEIIRHGSGSQLSMEMRALYFHSHSHVKN